MPTIDEQGELTNERMAPAGHGFVGVHALIKIFNDLKSKSINDCDIDQITVIGNGEDLNSTPSLELLKWVSEHNIPVVMITTTKTKNDLKGGQISLLKTQEKGLLTIVEKAQAEESGQLDYFEKLGLREDDREALFNTNIVIINESALRKKFKILKNIEFNSFLEILAPDVISNIKEQDGKKFTQLESALGSVMLNLDRFFRLKYDEKIVSIVNVDVENREDFFIPIKKRHDYDQILNDFIIDANTYRLKKVKV